jgi:hypothetical protein
MRVLGVTLSDPVDRTELEQAIRETLRVRVVATTERLIAELEAGAQPATAYFALTRFVLPNALYHMQVWGLLCTPQVWAEVDDAFTRFCVALCPVDQRDRLAASPAFRAELSLSQELGGLGIPLVEREARLRAADQWDHRDAVEANMPPEYVRLAYCQSDPVDPRAWRPRGMKAYYEATAESLADGLSAADARDLAWRRGRNQLRSALWAFAAVPWVAELTVDRVEWDVMWRLTFGGIPAEVLHRLDHPADGFAWRGRRMEYAVAQAIRECVPPGVLAISSQPAPERYPLDHADRCRREHVSPDGWKRADVGLAFVTGTTITLDVRTTNTQSASARGAASAEAHLRSQEDAKRAKYADYYRNFHPFVVDLGGAVTDRSYGALKLIMKEAAKADGPRLQWERFDWAARALRRIAVAMARTTAWLATRAPARPTPPDSWAGVGRPSALDRSVGAAQTGGND